MFPWDKPNGGAHGARGARLHSEQWVQANMVAKRKKEYEVNNIKAGLEHQSLSHAVAKSDARVINRRKRNDAFKMAAESVLEASSKDSEDEARRRSRAAEQDKALARELERRSREEEMRKREIQRICEEDETLRDLQEKLKAAYMNLERTAQIKEKSAIAEIESEKERQLDEIFEYNRRMGLAEEANKRKSKRIEYMKTRKVLSDQIKSKEDAIRNEAVRQYEKDKHEVDNIVKKIQAQDEAEFRLKRKKQSETKAYIDQFQKERKAFLARQKYEAEEYEKQIAKYAAEKLAREEGVVAKKMADRAYQDQLYAALKEAAESKMAEEREMEEFRETLHMEETENRLRVQEQAKRRAQEESVRSMIRANELQKKTKEDNRLKAEIEEKELIRKMMAKFAADEERERAEALAREEAKVEYKAGVEAQRRQLAEMYESEKKAELVEREYEADKEAFRMRVVEEARRRLLEEHAALLGDHLPKGVLVKEDDLKYLRK